MTVEPARVQRLARAGRSHVPSPALGMWGKIRLNTRIPYQASEAGTMRMSPDTTGPSTP